MNRRRGICLAELLVVLSACTLILSLSATMLHRAMRIQMRSRAAETVERSSLRLSDQFRRDVHQARTAKATPDANHEGFLTLQLPDDVAVEYRLIDGTVERTVSHRAMTTARDEFPFGHGCETTVSDEGSPHLIALTISGPTAIGPGADDHSAAHFEAPPVAFHVVARLGRDLRDKAAAVAGGPTQ